MIKLMKENDYSETDEFTLIKEMNHWIKQLKEFFVDDRKAQKVIADYFYYDDGAHQEDFKELQAAVKTLRKLRKKLGDIVEEAEEKEYKEKNKNESYRSLKEQDTKIEVKHEGILEVPEGKNVDELPISHFVKLAKKKGLSKITKALNNLQVWNKNDDPKLSKWAGDMIDKVSKKMEKEEKKESVKYIKEGLDFEVIHESDDDEGNPTLWGAEVNSHHYGKFMWIELSDVDGYYDLVYNAGGDRYKTIKSFMSFNKAKKFAEYLINQEKKEYDEI